MPQDRAVRIAEAENVPGISGSGLDRRDAMYAVAANCPDDPVDVIIGDWLSEANMTLRGAAKIAGTGEAYEPTFLDALEPALPHIAKHRIKVVANAGASDTKLLHDLVLKLIKEKELDLDVAWISGDEVMPAVKEALESKQDHFENVYTGEVLADWKFKPIYAQAYLGGLGIAEAFARGADIVVCGRVSDASLAIGAAYWWHNWQRSSLNELANAFVAGHLIECSNYVCGGNYTGFKDLESKGWDDIGYPIAEISKAGEVVITKSKGSGGEVSVDTCSSQLVYEIQGPWYYNSDVTAILDETWFEQLSTDRVAVRGVKSDLPPPTTKVGITAKGGYQAEVHWFLVGLDIEAKARMMEVQIRRLMKPYMDRYSKLTFTINGSCTDNPRDQNAATVDFRIFAQAPDMEALKPEAFLRPCLDPIMEAYPGATPHLDFRQGLPKPIYEYYVTLLPQSEIKHRVHLSSGETIDVAPPATTKDWLKKQPDQAVTSGVVDHAKFGETLKGPLGWLVHARSGDKGSDCNVGFWVRHHDEWDWLRSLLSTEMIKELLGEEYRGKPIDRFELPNMRAVHFLLHDHLDRGVSCSSSYDFLGKNVAEFLRLNRGDDAGQTSTVTDRQEAPPNIATMASFVPLNPRPMLQSLVGKEVLIRLKWGETEYKGVLVSTDSYMNVQLSNTEEFIDGKSTGSLGQVLIRSRAQTDATTSFGCPLRTLQAREMLK
ncbi:uncharacterized protein K452DRAFT_356161 [Aplosporella prunicola CBS 121167]|uniref:Sm protein F n=1 Tax=Aplosporella prunicola CBS 121167 TaxID=1176127 RepID=A0A6A6BRC1_9PEZI|nr:uncharacterized protein K452DRAFT_356161 [Aplosporella prunicola CBS 121167]KAF2145784.1 hypothetical protein K452DRAFT_356161 [Aplosporella prunicola CBS 121167]